MGCFDTYIIPCPSCNSLVEEQQKPGYMNTYHFGEDPEDDINFVGEYTCHSCKTNFSVEMENIPNFIVKKI